MNTEIINFIDSIINFCQHVLQIPIDLYTKGLVICPWVVQWIDYFKVEYNIDIMNVIEELKDVLEQLEMMG